MKKLLHILLGCWLVTFSVNAFCQTGVFYNQLRNGEGITAYDDGERLLFYYYTNGAESCEIIEDEVTVEACATVTATASIPCPAADSDAYDENCVPISVDVTNTECESEDFTDMSKSCDLNGQRFFFGADVFDGIEATGVLYVTEGLDFPLGIPNPEIWQAVFVAEAIPVGLYLAEWDGEGWQVTVIPFGDELGEDDPLYGVHLFDTLLFKPQ